MEHSLICQGVVCFSYVSLSQPRGKAGTQRGPKHHMHAKGMVNTSITNDSIITPVGFYVTGFTELAFADLYLIFLWLHLYCNTVLCNSFIISIIWMDHRLHTPKYIAVANLAVVDLMRSTCFIPSSINTVFTRDTFMFYNACLTQIFVLLQFYNVRVIVPRCTCLRQANSHMFPNAAQFYQHLP